MAVQKSKLLGHESNACSGTDNERPDAPAETVGAKRFSQAGWRKIDEIHGERSIRPSSSNSANRRSSSFANASSATESRAAATRSVNSETFDGCSWSDRSAWAATWFNRCVSPDAT